VFIQEGRYRLDVALEEVLVQNKIEFVRLFLEIGADLKRFLNKHRLLDLYERVNEVLNLQLDDEDDDCHRRTVPAPVSSK